MECWVPGLGLAQPWLFWPFECELTDRSLPFSVSAFQIHPCIHKKVFLKNPFLGLPLYSWSHRQIIGVLFPSMSHFSQIQWKRLCFQSEGARISIDQGIDLIGVLAKRRRLRKVRKLSHHSETRVVLLPGPGKRDDGKLLLSRCRVAVEGGADDLRDGHCGWWCWMHSDVTILNASELYT